jgi:beta-glucosidase
MQRLPEDFNWGCASASYQVEGVVAEGGRCPSIWDTFSHTPGNVANGDNGDVAVDFYHRYREDIQLMHELGFRSYRMSISPCRIFPNGFRGEPNPEAVQFYNDVIDAQHT